MSDAEAKIERLRKALDEMEAAYHRTPDRDEDYLRAVIEMRAVLKDVFGDH